MPGKRLWPFGHGYDHAIVYYLLFIVSPVFGQEMLSGARVINGRGGIDQLNPNHRVLNQDIIINGHLFSIRTVSDTNTVGFCMGGNIVMIDSGEGRPFNNYDVLLYNGIQVTNTTGSITVTGTRGRVATNCNNRGTGITKLGARVATTSGDIALGGIIFSIASDNFINSGRYILVFGGPWLVYGANISTRIEGALLRVVHHFQSAYPVLPEFIVAGFVYPPIAFSRGNQYLSQSTNYHNDFNDIDRGVAIIVDNPYEKKICANIEIVNTADGVQQSFVGPVIAASMFANNEVVTEKLDDSITAITLSESVNASFENSSIKSSKQKKISENKTVTPVTMSLMTNNLLWQSVDVMYKQLEESVRIDNELKQLAKHIITGSPIDLSTNFLFWLLSMGTLLSSMLLSLLLWIGLGPQSILSLSKKKRRILIENQRWFSKYEQQKYAKMSLILDSIFQPSSPDCIKKNIHDKYNSGNSY